MHKENGYLYIGKISSAYVVWNKYNLDNQAMKRFFVHHKDKKPLNNDISNLKLVTKAEHDKIHNKGA